mgnify:CR=1 FL=1
MENLHQSKVGENLTYEVSGVRNVICAISNHVISIARGDTSFVDVRMKRIYVVFGTIENKAPFLKYTIILRNIYHILYT